MSEVLGMSAARYLRYLGRWELLGTAILLPRFLLLRVLAGYRLAQHFGIAVFLCVASIYVVFFRGGRLTGEVQVCVTVAVCLWEVPCSQ